MPLSVEKRLGYNVSTRAESLGHLPREISRFWRQPVPVIDAENGGAAGHLSA